MIGIEVYSPLYVSSETLMGMNLCPCEEGEAEYVLNLVENVFEFIQEDEMYGVVIEFFIIKYLLLMKMSQFNISLEA